MKYLKGVYLVSDEELDILIEARKSGNSVEYKNKKLWPLYSVKKTRDIENIDEFNQAVVGYAKKKEICTALGTSYFKFTKFAKTHYGTENLSEIRRKIKG